MIVEPDQAEEEERKEGSSAVLSCTILDEFGCIFKHASEALAGICCTVASRPSKNQPHYLETHLLSMEFVWRESSSERALRRPEYLCVG